MDSRFVVWGEGLMRDGICKLNGLIGVEDEFELREGISRLEGWLDEASAQMHSDFPQDTGLADSLYGAGLVVSSAVRKLLDEEAVSQVEYLPLKILDHAGKVASADYFLVNPLAIIDCIDAEASAVKEDSLDAGNYTGCKQLVLREESIPAEQTVFRLAHWPKVVVIQRKLADTMKAAGFTCLRFTEPREYKG